MGELNTSETGEIVVIRTDPEVVRRGKDCGWMKLRFKLEDGREYEISASRVWPTPAQTGGE